MKKFLALFISSLILSAFYSCGETSESNEVETPAKTNEIDANIDELKLDFDASKIEYKDFKYDAFSVPVPSYLKTDVNLEDNKIIKLIPETFFDTTNKQTTFYMEIYTAHFSSEDFSSNATNSDPYSVIDKLFLHYLSLKNDAYTQYEPYNAEQTCKLDLDKYAFGRAYAFKGTNTLGRDEILGATDIMYDKKNERVFIVTASDYSKNISNTSEIFNYITLNTTYNPNFKGNTNGKSPVEALDASNKSTVTDDRKAVESGDYSLVTPEFKATMDAYEAFYDEYIAFMNKYNSGEGDITSMMDDYMNMLDKMTEWTNKINAIDEKSLSPADDAYYLLVTMRVEKKLLGAL